MIGECREIAAKAVFLALCGTRFLNGNDYNVDGGMLAAHPGL